MRPLLLGLIASCLIMGCSCSETGIEGRADSYDDLGVDMAEDDTPVPCPDRDGDGYLDAACGGDDCDDTNPLAYPGATEICNDGVDEDCDGSADDPIFLSETIQLSNNPRDSATVTPQNLTWTGSEYLVDWNEAEDWTGGRIKYFGRISATGDRIIAKTEIENYRITAWNGYLLASTWDEELDGGGFDVRFRLLDPLGVAVSDEHIVQETHEEFHTLSRRDVVWTGSSFTVVWGDRGSTSDTEIWYAELGADGTLLRPPTLVELAMGMTDDTRMIWTGESCLFARWSDIDPFDHVGGVHVLEVHPETGLVHELAVLAEGHVGLGASRDIAWTGSSIGVAWEPDVPHSEHEVHFEILDTSGSPLTDEIVFPGEAFSTYADLVWTDRAFGMLYTEQDADSATRMRLVTLGPDGERVAEDLTLDFTEDGLLHSGHLVWTGSELGLAWSEITEGFEAFFRRIGYCQ